MNEQDNAEAQGARTTYQEPERDVAQEARFQELMRSDPEALPATDPRIQRLSRFSTISAMSTALPQIFARFELEAVVQDVCGDMAEGVLDSASGNAHQIHDAIGALKRRGVITRELFAELRRFSTEPAHQRWVDAVRDAWFEPASDRFSQLGRLLLALHRAQALTALLAAVPGGDEIRTAIVNIPEKSNEVYCSDLLRTLKRHGHFSDRLFVSMLGKRLTGDPNAVLNHLWHMYRAQGAR